MKIIEKPANVWYLEIIKPNAIYKDKSELSFQLQKNINIEDYLSHYIIIGEPWDWSGRLCMERGDLQNHLNDDKNEIYFCYQNGKFAGYFELDTHKADIEIVYFGVVPKYIGKGVGREMMLKALQIASIKNSNRVWLHTCEFDSPNALPFYIKMGFNIFDERIENQKIIVKE